MDRNQIILVTIASVLAAVLIWGGWLWTGSWDSQRLLNHKDVILGDMNSATPRGGQATTQIIGVLGDIFTPNAHGTQRTFNALFVTATIDPNITTEDGAFFVTNSLMRSLVAHLEQDPGSHPLLTQILDRLNRTRAETERDPAVCTAALPDEAAFRRQQGSKFVNAHCFPFIVALSPENTLYHEGIRHLVILPLFMPTGDPSVARFQRSLALAVRKGVANGLFQLTRENPNLQGVAIPALAGTTHLSDSWRYLTYDQSFLQILRGIRETQASVIPLIYLVTWDGLPTGARKEATTALVDAGLVLSSPAIIKVVIFLILAGSFVASLVLSGQPFQIQQKMVRIMIFFVVELLSVNIPDALLVFLSEKMYQALSLSGLMILALPIGLVASLIGIAMAYDREAPASQ